jgi:septum formation protein
MDGANPASSRSLKWILASSSPRRAEILRNAGFLFEIFPADVDETRFPHEAAEDYVRRLAAAKSRLAADRFLSSAVKNPSQNSGAAIVIAADTIVVVDGEIFGKPANAADARRMLLALSDRTHEVLTALSLAKIPGGPEALHVESTVVSFVPLSEKDVDDYIATGEPFDKAGAYGIQGIGGRFIWRIEGCYFNVMGLPLSRLWTTMRSFSG